MSAVEAAKKAAKAEAALWVWASVVEILVGSSSPDRGVPETRPAVLQVLKIANTECQRCLAVYDAALATIAAQQGGEA